MKEKEILEAKAKIEEGIRLINDTVDKIHELDKSYSVGVDFIVSEDGNNRSKIELIRLDKHYLA